MSVFRGEKPPGVKPLDPGDFGQGTYYSSRRARAEQYGKLTEHKLTLQNPLILDVESAYREIADRFGTISGKANSPTGAGDMTLRALRSEETTKALRERGYDGVVVVNDKSGEIEFVKFPTAKDK